MRKVKGISAIGFAAIFMFAGSLTAADEFVKGKVVDEDGKPIEGAYISFVNKITKGVFTDSKGEFLEEFTSVVKTPVRLSNANIQVSSVGRGKALSVKLDGRGNDVVVDLFTGNGSRILSKKLRNDRVKNTEIDLGQFSRGLILARVSVGNDAGYYKIMPQMGMTSLVSSPKLNKVQTQAALSKQTAEIIDSVVVVAPSYRSKLKAIQSYSVDDLEIVLSKSNPWIPDGELERNGSMVKIYANGYDFEMGSPRDMWGMNARDKMERPVHTAKFTYDFWMDTTEVTQGDYISVMKSYAEFDSAKEAAALAGFSYAKGDDQPVYNVEFGDMALYCNARSKQDGYDTVYEYSSVSGTFGIRSNLVDVKMNESADGYRLPTEAEWEYAYRGGTFTDFYWGKDYSWYEEDEGRTDYTDYGAMKTNAWDENITTYPVAHFLPNNYGLYDMAGNLAEFCNNQPYLYKYGTVTDPMVSSVYKAGTQRMIRGGAWNNEVCYLRGSNRTFYASDYAYWYIGFRAVRVEK